MSQSPLSAQTREIQQLIEAAKTARLHSYSPYSHHKVGAALRTRDGKIFSGCNVENSSYGGSICAERSAIVSAISQVGQIEIAEIAVLTDSNPPWPPCGMCRQVIAEFGLKSVIYCANLKGDVVRIEFKDLMPQAFTPAHLNSNG